MSNYRVQQYESIQELVARVTNNTYPAGPSHGKTVSTDERPHQPKAIIPEAPINRSNAVLTQQYNDNLRAEQFTRPEVFGSGNNGRHKVVIKAENAANDAVWRESYSAATPPRPGAQRDPRIAGAVTVDREQVLADSVRQIEEVALPAFKNPPRRALQVAQRRPLPKSVPAGGYAVEATSPNYVYTPGGDYGQTYAKNVKVFAGDGREFDDPERTKTFVA